MKNKGGRPSKPIEEKKINSVRVRLTDNELQDLNHCAEILQTSKSDVLLLGLEKVKAEIK